MVPRINNASTFCGSFASTFLHSSIAVSALPVMLLRLALARSATELSGVLASVSSTKVRVLLQSPNSIASNSSLLDGTPSEACAARVNLINSISMMNVSLEACFDQF